MTAGEMTTDAFGAARWFDELSNSRARAVSPELIEWECRTWGSGRGRGAWTDAVLFTLVAKLFALDTGKNRDGRDELIVWVPLERFAEIAGLIERIGEVPEDWPWLDGDSDTALSAAAAALGRTVGELEEDYGLRKALQLV